MLIGQNPTLLVGEGLVVAMIWGVPSWLVFRAWRRYQRLDGVQTSLRIAMSSLLISEAMLLVVGVVVAVEITSTTRMLSSPQELGVINFFFCAIALLAPFVGKTRETIHVRKAITVASIYLLFVWLYAMLAH
jgi:hypothetical protein